jgi:hypothetical protein
MGQPFLITGKDPAWTLNDIREAVKVGMLLCHAHDIILNDFPVLFHPRDRCGECVSTDCFSSSSPDRGFSLSDIIFSLYCQFSLENAHDWCPDGLVCLYIFSL